MKRKTSNYNIYEAKTRFSELIGKARNGEEVVIMNRGEPVVKIVPFQELSPKRKLGFAMDIKILSGFKEIPEGFEDLV